MSGSIRAVMVRGPFTKDEFDRVVALAMRNKPSVDFCGYWQRSWAA